LRQAGVVFSGAMMGAAGLGSLSGCGDSSDWQGKAFPKVVLHNFNLLDGQADYLQKGKVLLIEESAIKGIESMGDLSRYSGFRPVDLKGMTLLPGLIDNHVHITVPFMYSVNVDTVRQMNSQITLNFKNCINSGVTTVRDVGGFPGKINKYREMADSNRIPGPRVISSLSPIGAREGERLGAPEKAPYFTNPVIKWILGGNYAERPIGVASIKTACEEMVQQGARWLKTLHQDHPYSYSKRPLPNHTDEGYRAIIATGRKYGIKSALHEPLVSGFKKGVDLGFHTLEHMPMDAGIPDDYIDRFIKQDMAMMPTMMIYGDSFIFSRLLQMIEKQGRTYLMPEAVKQMSERLKKVLTLEKKKLTREEYDRLQFDNKYAKDKFPQVMANLKKLYQRGAVIGAGTDIGGTATGFFGRYTDELRHYASAGIPLAGIIKMATSINADIIDMSNEIGSIEKGKLADMIAVEGNPLVDLNALDRVKMVMKGGLFVRSDGIDLG
jgi:imidazolonepropionase-like amidohydrolase